MTSNNTQTGSTISEKLSLLVEVAHERMTLDIVNSLNFATRGARQSNVVEAHQHTFEWIFEEHKKKYGGTVRTARVNNNVDSNNNNGLGSADSQEISGSQTTFLNWLRFRNDNYWISGKFGSGKSTLMRYIVEDTRTERELQSWAGEAKLVTASCFFWCSGESLQKSHQGMLQSLLYQILTQCPDLVPAVCCSRYRTFGSNFRRWSRRELLEVFEQLSRRTQTLKFCFFIDSLDELEGNHKEIIQALKEFSVSPNVKICLSSRPLNVFLKAFGTSDQKLLLEEHKKADIQLYVNQVLQTDNDYIQLVAVDSRCNALVEEIVSTARGVFLWVRLVVSELLNGLGNEDDIGDLQRRLRRLPRDLEDYFQLMLRRIDENDREEAAELFRLRKEAIGSLSVDAVTFYKLE